MAEEQAKGYVDISPQDLKARLDNGEKPFILDVRNPDEFAAGHLADATLIPLNELPNKLSELDPDQEVVVHCKMGGRGAQASAYLVQQGFKDVKHLRGGLMAWSKEIDPSVRVH